eukprot:6194216-Pleurochrysis_carterae.AAC.2
MQARTHTHAHARSRTLTGPMSPPCALPARLCPPLARRFPPSFLCAGTMALLLSAWPTRASS